MPRKVSNNTLPEVEIQREAGFRGIEDVGASWSAGVRTIQIIYVVVEFRIASKSQHVADPAVL